MKQMWNNLGWLPKIVILAVILFCVWHFGLSKVTPKPTQTAKLSTETQALVDDGTPLVNVGVVTWPGYAGGEYFNRGFTASKESRYYTDYHMLVNFKVLDDFDASRTEFKTGGVDLLWVTADAYDTETAGLAEYQPIFAFQADWSRGGDAIVVVGNARTVNDLRGKKIAVALGTPSHTLLIMMLKSAGMTVNDVQIITCKDALAAAAAFKAGTCDAAVVWAPDDAVCVKTVPGARILINSKKADHIIADGFFAKKSWVEKNPQLLQNLIKGWMIGAAEINTSDAAKEEAILILMKGLGLERDVVGLDNVRLTTLGDNKNFFGLGSATAVTGEKLYTTMTREYTAIGFIKDQPPTWRSVSTSEFISKIGYDDLPGGIAVNGPEGATKFTALSNTAASEAEVIGSKGAPIEFATGSSALDEISRSAIDAQIGLQAQTLGGIRMVIEGNTDNTGSAVTNRKLSLLRAKSVALYLTNKYGLDPNKFNCVGNGPDKPIADNSTESGRAANRRTEIKLIR